MGMTWCIFIQGSRFHYSHAGFESMANSTKQGASCTSHVLSKLISTAHDTLQAFWAIFCISDPFLFIRKKAYSNTVAQPKQMSLINQANGSRKRNQSNGFINFISTAKFLTRPISQFALSWSKVIFRPSIQVDNQELLDFAGTFVISLMFIG
jgi:hypothetical protein